MLTAESYSVTLKLKVTEEQALTFKLTGFKVFNSYTSNTCLFNYFYSTWK